MADTTIVSVSYPQTARTEEVVTTATTVNGFVRHGWHRGRRYYIEFRINGKNFHYNDMSGDTPLPDNARCTFGVAPGTQGTKRLHHKFIARETEVALANGYFTKETVDMAKGAGNQKCSLCTGKGGNSPACIYAPHDNRYYCGACCDARWMDLFDRDLIWIL